MSSRNLVDSSGWIEFLNGSERADLFSEAITNTAALIVSVISIYEVVKRIRRDSNEQDAMKAVHAMTLGAVVNLDLTTSLAATQYKLQLADSIIYATARRFDATLWTQDEDFEGLPGVKYFPK
jgi:predicted nucleic acid-binding protein